MATQTEQKAEKQDTQLVEFVPYGTKDKISLSIEIVKRLIAVKTKSGKTCSDEDAFKFMLMCQARKLNPFEGDAFLVGYDNNQQPDKPSFSLITAHQAFLKRAELHPEFDGMDSGTIVMRNGEAIDLLGDWHMPNDNILGGWAVVYFKNRSHPMKKRVRLARFNKQYGIWRDDPAGMIVKCAEADALRSSFPTMLGGMFISEEMPPVVEAEIARPIFQGVIEPAAEAEIAQAVPAVEKKPESAVEKKAEPAPPKKKEPPPALMRKAAKAEAPSTEKSLHQKFTDMLAIGNCTAEEFIKIAIDEGWVAPDEAGTFIKISEDRVAEFMKEDNWNYIMQAIDEHRAKADKPSTTKTQVARTGELL